MFKLSKKAEYALMAARYMALNNHGQCVTAKEISESYNISYELLAKVLQNLVKMGIINSFQGSKGGYNLSKKPEEISLTELISAVEKDYKIISCYEESSTKNDCLHLNFCKIRDPLILVQQKLDKVFQETKLVHII
ncbi:MAG: Rrf2 family transcriptional regulator [Ignavibacteriaceae bacterium]|nr:Rrf2 family transcriptional regulator [Ignavibacteriaceae bacterium]